MRLLAFRKRLTKIKKERRNEYGEYDENVYYRR